MLESVWSSMSNSVYSSPDSDYEENFDNAPESEQVSGLEVFTQAIESSNFLKILLIYPQMYVYLWHIVYF